MGGKYPYRLWAEHLDVFDEVVVLGRGGPLGSAPGRLSLSSGPGVSHVFLGGRRGLARLGEVLLGNKEIERHVREADCVIARLPSEIGLAACAAASAQKKPYLVEVVASAWDALWHHGSIAARAYAPVLEMRTKAAVGGAPLARYVTESFLQRCYPARGRVFTASNVVLEPLDREVLTLRRASLMADSSPLVFGTIGSLNSRMKGLHDAIAALSALKDELPPFTYRILGEGDAEPFRRLAERAGLADRMFFDGVLPAGAPVAAWLDGVDVYLQPSLQEGLPRAVIEALGRACLAVASTAGGTPELLPPKRLHPPGRHKALALAISDLVKSAMEEKCAEVEANWLTAARYEASALVARRAESYQALAALAASLGGGRG
ncbi:glycosyltransferase family 4 protein [Caulobacter sp. NIBR2454]|uniref:glycosyltransferase family 4 protein n=1 Tax=Caulobacter sp. NIBR2454 TaxID=3015996 RepID=UPI0022B6A07F|nr:glycosyltransferase family 4 protein [Caulobacter sp. NIBR2454]